MSVTYVGPKDPILSAHIPPYAGETRALRTLAVQMYELMCKPVGRLICVGLAAPQVGERVRMFVMNTKRPRQRTWGSTWVCINPVVLERRGVPLAGVEFSLSRPDGGYRVSRCEEIRVEYTDLEGRRRRETLLGMQARAFQHELDHLDGLTIWAQPRDAVLGSDPVPLSSSGASGEPDPGPASSPDGVGPSSPPTPETEPIDRPKDRAVA